MLRWAKEANGRSQGEYHDSGDRAYPGLKRGKSSNGGKRLNRDTEPPANLPDEHVQEMSRKLPEFESAGPPVTAETATFGARWLAN